MQQAVDIDRGARGIDENMHVHVHQARRAYRPAQVDALDVDARDTTGAGDTFVGVFAAALDFGVALPEALARASVGASLACLKLGAQQSIPTASMIEERLREIGPARRDNE